MRTEADAFFRDLAEIAQGEDLEASGVGKQSAVPAHEAMQAAELADELVPGPEIEVIGVAQNDPRAQLFQRTLWNCLDRSLGADRHEDWGLHGSVG